MTDTGETRYAQVRRILNTAAGDSAADYGGIGRFWDRGVETLRSAKVYGVAMVAPEAMSCCATPDEAAAAPKFSAAVSGLIKGLKGEAPFDGQRLPPLPWGGRRVTPEDIEFIARWIDDGLPAEDHETVVEVGALQAEAEPSRVVLAQVADFEFAEGSHPAPRFGPRQRVNLDCMTEAEIFRLRRGFRHLYFLNRWPEDRRNYNNQALIHQNHCQHGWERFLPWHRAYLYEFEQNLQDFDASLTLPYWDWTMPHYAPETPEQGGIIPKSFKAVLTEAAAAALVDALQPAPTAAQKAALLKLAGPDVCFVSQHALFSHVVNEIGYTHITPAPDDPNRRHVIDALLASNALWYPLRYPAEYHTDGTTITASIHYHYPSAQDMAQISSLNNFRDFGGGSVYDAAFGFLDQNPHNTMHIWTGGENPDLDQPTYAARTASQAADTAAGGDHSESLDDLRNAMTRISGRRFHARKDLYSQPKYGDMFSNLTASYDPIFWPIHVNIDRIWWEWQLQNPSAAPADQDAVLAPWNYTIRDTLDMAHFGYEYVRGSHYLPVGLEAAVGRFISAPIKVGREAQGFRKAEIRLHHVPQLPRSCFIRAFLNQPDAITATPLRGNPNFAGYLAIFGHGACYGGPGHCDLPPAQPREYDRRGRSHNAPRNHRIDVTTCAKAILAGTDVLRITLLVIGGDYREDRELLKLEGVSLSFFD
jgi:tyrosinase